MMHQAQMERRFYTFIQNDVKVIDVAAELSYDLKNYLDQSVEFPAQGRERKGMQRWSHRHTVLEHCHRYGSLRTCKNSKR
jgi:hypothetical protein